MSDFDYSATIKQGQTWRVRVSAKQADGTTAYNLTGATARATLRLGKFDAPDVAATILSAVESATLGTVLLSLSDESTAALAPGKYVFDAFVDLTSGDAFPLVKAGQLIVTASATRA